jgi:hypothetical protein
MVRAMAMLPLWLVLQQSLCIVHDVRAVTELVLVSAEHLLTMKAQASDVDVMLTECHQITLSCPHNPFCHVHNAARCRHRQL